MRKYPLILVFVFLAIVNIGKPAHAQSAPILIHNCRDLQNMENNLAGNYVLANDIVDCNTISNFQPIGSLTYPFPGASGQYAPFTGSFDGLGHTIEGLNINGNPKTNDHVGLFAAVNTVGEIKNVVLDNFHVTGGGNCVGALAGFITKGNVSNVRVNNSNISGITAGGTSLGGLIGQMSSGSINNSAVINTNVIGSTWDLTVGGLVGMLGGGSSAQINASYSTGFVSGELSPNVSGGFAVGGLVGEIVQESGNEVVSNSYSLSHVTSPGGNAYIGGLIGLIQNNSNTYIVYITNCFAAGLVDNKLAGGVVGGVINTPGDIVSSSIYWDVQATRQNTDGLPNSVGETTVKMYRQSTYANWDFNNTWISDNKQYPALIWQEQPQIDLWNTFSAASQISTSENANPPASVNWTNIDAFASSVVGVNWSSLENLSKPTVWDYQSAIFTSSSINSVNWTYLDNLSNTPINWSDIYTLTTSNINWATVNPLVRSGVNWFDWMVASVSHINWRDVAILSSQGINWTSVGTSVDDVNWSDLAEMSQQGINWGLVNEFSQEGVNWSNASILNDLKMSQANLNTLRSIGVGADGRPPVILTAQVTLNISGTGSGTITSSPAGLNCSSACSASFIQNQLITLTFSSSNGSVISSWDVTGCASSSDTCVVSPDTDIAIDVVTSATTYTIAASAASGGTISPSGNITVNQGGSKSFTITPNAGYMAYISIDGAATVPLTGNTYVFNNVTAAHSIAASFKLITYTIQASVSGIGGTIAPLGNNIVNYGANKTFTITANPRHSAYVSIDGGLPVAVSGNTYTFYDVTTSHTIKASFLPSTYVITATAGVGGQILPSGAITVRKGMMQPFSVLPNKNYKINQVLVDGLVVKLLAGSIYIFNDVTATHTISASFTPIVYHAITASAGVGGTISPSGNVNVADGQRQTFAITVNKNYEINQVLVDNKIVKLSLTNTYAFSDVTTAHTISASFKKKS